MAADVVHVGFGVPYLVSSMIYAGVLAAVFVGWHARERSLSIHAITTFTREIYYWSAVVATFAMGTAVGDLTAVTFNLGYPYSAILFAGLIATAAVGYFHLGWNPIFAFWASYVLTRPLGASVADWLGKPRSAGGRGFGDGPVCAILTCLILLLVGILAITRADVQRDVASDPAQQES